MKIGILAYPTSGGSGVIASELGMALAARGHDVHLFSYRSPFRLRPHSDRFQWHEISIPQYPLFEYPSYGMAAACRVAEIDLDVLHCHYAYPHAVSAFLAKEMTGQKLRTVTTLMNLANPSCLASCVDCSDTRLAVPPMWNVRMVSCVPGSPMDCAAMMPTASPSFTIAPVACWRP